MPFYVKDPVGNNDNRFFKLGLPGAYGDYYIFSSGGDDQETKEVTTGAPDGSETHRYPAHYYVKINNINRQTYLMVPDDVIECKCDDGYTVYFQLKSQYSAKSGTGRLKVDTGKSSTIFTDTAWTHTNSNSKTNTMPPSSWGAQCFTAFGTVHWRGNRMNANGDAVTIYSRIYKAAGDASFKSIPVCNDCSHMASCTNASSGGGTNPCCLEKNTLIKLSNGKAKPISEIKTGDIIYGFHKGNIVETRVKGIFIAFPKQSTLLYSIKTDSGKILKITGKHPIACKSEYKTIEKTNGFKQLEESEILLTGERILSISSEPITDVVFNLKTDMDNFIVNGFIVACEDTENYDKCQINSKIGATNIKVCDTQTPSIMQ